MNINDFVITKHVLERALDMGVTGDEIRKCLENPKTVVPSAAYPGRFNFDRGRITCVVNREDMAVLTVLWANDRLWKKDLRAGTYGGRELRV